MCYLLLQTTRRVGGYMEEAEGFADCIPDFGNSFQTDSFRQCFCDNSLQSLLPSVSVSLLL